MNTSREAAVAVAGSGRGCSLSVGESRAGGPGLAALVRREFAAPIGEGPMPSPAVRAAAARARERSAPRSESGVPVTRCAWWMARVGGTDRITIVCVVQAQRRGRVRCVKPTAYKRTGPDDARAFWTKPFWLHVSAMVEPASLAAVEAVTRAHGSPLAEVAAC